ncbi:MAG: hypothetical protein IJT74_00570 [Bacteroidales bacterium]|nr:hypothetical protein [Bacteroidales bacterium]
MSFEKKVIGTLPPRVTCAEAMLDTIRDLGIVPFFANVIPGYSIEEMTPPENWFDTQENLSYTPWDWKIPCVQSGEIAYGKFLLGGKAAFATVEWYRELRNWRQSQPKYRPDAAQQQVLDYLAKNGSIGIKEIRGLLGIKKGQADALMTRLMMQCRAVTGDIIRVFRGPDLHYNGWQTSSFCTPEALFGLSDDAPAAKAPSSFFGFPYADDTPAQPSHTPAESYDRLKEHIRSLFPEATDAQIVKLLG